MSQPTITEIMRLRAEEAAGYARSRFRMKMDFTSQSLEQVDRILAAMFFDVPRTFFAKLFRRGPSHEEVWDFSRMWGAYVGEVIRKRWGGTWKSSMQPDGHAQISLDVLGQKYYPVEEMHRRLVEGRGKMRGKGNGALDLYERVVKELGMARIDALGNNAPVVAPPLPRKMDPIPPSAPLLTRRQTVSDILGLEPEDITGEKSFPSFSDARPEDDEPLRPEQRQSGAIDLP